MMFRVSGVWAVFLACSALMLCQPAYAQTASKADVAALANDPFWLKLIHYKDTLSFTGDVSSDILTEAFFLSPAGPKDPAAELSATIAAMSEPVGSDPDTHAQCRFPARHRWLKARGALSGRTDEPLPCKAFAAWRGDAPVTGLSLVFASGYLKNPASYYGHMLLKLNTDRAATPGGALLETSLNYGAVYPPNENGVLYILKGLAGGYTSTYSQLAFFNHQYNYAEEQLRDVWEYELELTQAQTDYLVAHAFEVFRTHNRYYFLRQNCAYRLAELVNLVIERPLIPPNKGWVMPIDVFRGMVEARDGEPSLVRKITRMESRQNAFREQYLSLPADDRRLVREHIAAGGKSMAGVSQIADPVRKARVLETLIDWYGLEEAEAKPEDTFPRDHRNQLLRARLALPPGSAKDQGRQTALPHEGQGSSLLQASAVSNSAFGDGVELRFRGAYYDFLTYAPGVLPDSELTLVDARLAVGDGKVRLRAFEILRVTTLNTSPTGLAQDARPAWKLRLGLEQRDLSCKDCDVIYVEGGYGAAATPSRSITAYGFLNGRLTGMDNLDAYLEAGAAAGVIFGPGRAWRAQLEAGVWQQVDGPENTRPYGKAELRLGASPSWDVRAGFQVERVSGASVREGRLSLSRYW